VKRLSVAIVGAGMGVLHTAAALRRGSSLPYTSRPRAKYQVPRFLSNQARAVVGASAWRFQVKVLRASGLEPDSPLSSVVEQREL
jgi:hypothetical protein